MPAYVAVLIAAALIGGPTPRPSGEERAGAAHAAPAKVRALTGVASWYATGPQGPGHAAADKRLQRWLGPRWRGSIVNVCTRDRSTCVEVRVDDTCGCPGHRVIDLHPEDFVILAPTSLGITDVVVTR
jgi:hypothetical protein